MRLRMLWCWPWLEQYLKWILLLGLVLLLLPVLELLVQLMLLGK